LRSLRYERIASACSVPTLLKMASTSSCSTSWRVRVIVFRDVELVVEILVLDLAAEDAAFRIDVLEVRVRTRPIEP